MPHSIKIFSGSSVAASVDTCDWLVLGEEEDALGFAFLCCRIISSLAFFNSSSAFLSIFVSVFVYHS